MISSLQWLEKRWGARACCWAIAICQQTELNIKANQPWFHYLCARERAKWRHKLCIERMRDADSQGETKSRANSISKSIETKTDLSDCFSIIYWPIYHTKKQYLFLKPDSPSILHWLTHVTPSTVYQSLDGPCVTNHIAPLLDSRRRSEVMLIKVSFA